jgi:hypothetical protein
MNLLVTEVTPTHVVSRHCHKSTLPALHSRWGGFPPYTICRTYGQISSLLSSELMSGLAIVADAPVSMVTIYDLPPNHPLAFRLSLHCLAAMLNVQKGGSNNGTILYLILESRSTSPEAVLLRTSLPAVSPRMSNTPTLPICGLPSPAMLNPW